MLLLILQFFWMRSEYRTVESSFKKETNLAFKNTVSGLMDSLFMARVDFFNADSVTQNNREKYKQPDNFENRVFNKVVKVLKSDIRDTALIIVTKDSLELSSDIIKEKALPEKSFMVRVTPDSLDILLLRKIYNHRLKEIDRNLIFRIIVKDDVKFTNIDTSYITDFIKVGPRSSLQYAASFEGVQLSLLKDIYPQIFFSAILTIIIVASFHVLYKNLQMQQRLITQKDNFINNVSHELKTPIATVNVALEAFKDFKALDNPKLTIEYIDIMKAELDRLSLMTDRILNASVYESKGVDIVYEKFNFKEVLVQIIKTMAVVWNKEGVSIEAEISRSDFVFVGSRTHLTNIIHNLLENAIKYSNKPTRILVKLEVENQNIILKVADHGFGIPKEYHEKIFEKFFRVPHGDVHNVKGYGLGLCYVAQVVKAHHGSVYVKSEVGKGSTFTVKLPTNAKG